MDKLELLQTHSKATYNHIGYEDTIVNHTLMQMDTNRNKIVFDQRKLKKKFDRNILGKRYFTVYCIAPMESLTLNFKDIDLIKRDFKMYWGELLKGQID